MLGSSLIGVIHLDRRGRLLQMNDRAHALVRQGDGLFDRDGHLHARLPADESRLQCLVASALPAHHLTGASGSMTVRRTCRAPRLSLHVLPATGYPLGCDRWRVAAIVLGPRSHVDSGMVAAILSKAV